MAWTIYNASTASINVTDIAQPQQILPATALEFEFADVMQSRVLAQNIALGALVVTACGDYGPMTGPVAPVTYSVHALQQESQDGNSGPFTMAPFSDGLLLLNVTALGSGSSVAIGFEPWDGATYYPAVSAVAAQTVVGPVTQTFKPAGIAGRFTWTVVGTATFGLLYQVQ